MADKNHCPICLIDEEISLNNCMICMGCKQKIHGTCLFESNNKKLPRTSNRYLRDDILNCPICRGDRIAFCRFPDDDINEDIKEAIREDPNRKGGKKSRRRRTIYKRKTSKRKIRKTLRK